MPVAALPTVSRRVRLALFTVALGSTLVSVSTPATAQEVEYILMATNKTSTMEKELNGGAESGYRFEGVMGGETAFGGNEVVALMSRTSGAPKGRYRYKLLATSKTSTMQREIEDAGDAGYEYRGQTVFESLFGGKEVVVILERDKDAPVQNWKYKLLATSKTSTMEKELREAGALGFAYVGVTVGQTAMGGSELVVITRKPEAGR
jgi:hypothetical protein